jgi:hypothetical protein
MLYTKPARHSHKNTSMDVLVEIPEHIVEAAPDPQALAEEVVSALNCCRKYKKGMLTIHMDADLEEYVAIKIKGQARAFKALQALNQWMDVEDAFELLGNLSGLPRSCRTIEGLDIFGRL